MIGKTLGHYQVVDKLGEGGMGVVYKARDLHLDRFVALKVLPPEKVADPERKRRFIQEAKAASALNHAHIVHIYDISSDAGVDFIAMEYAEGKTLDHCIGRNLRLNDTLKYGVQIADALAQAHSAGIVHRDLKPSNIMVTSDGAVKILDFGLAKLTEQMQGDGSATAATADVAAPVTERGTIVGTVAYMSPEQAEGKTVDPRSDIFSFGSVLYEMITGRRPFQGDSKIATLSSILHQEPAPVSQVAGGVPQELERIIARCLKKDPARRIQTMADLKVALEELKEESDSGRLLSQSGTAAIERRSSKLMTVTVIAAGILVLAAAILYHFWKPGGMARTAVPAGQPTHRQITFTANSDSPEISPEGTVVAYIVGNFGEDNSLMLQDLSGGPPVELLRASGGISLAPERWSPDGTELLVSRQSNRVETELLLVRRLGGSSRILVKLSGPGFEACWSPDGTQIAIGNHALGQVRFSLVDKSNGSSREVTLSGIAGILLSHLDWSRATGLLLGVTRLDNRNWTIWTFRVDGSSGHKVVEERENRIGSARWSAAGDAIYYFRDKGGMQGTLSDLMKVPIDSASGEAKNEPSVISSGMEVNSNLLSLPGDGSRLIYTRIQRSNNLWLAEISGSEKQKRLKTRPLTKGALRIGSSSISPDGKWIAFATNRPNANIYKMPIDGGAPVQLTFSKANHSGVAWSPDGKRIAFISDGGGSEKVWIEDADGGTPRRLAKTQPWLVGNHGWAPSHNILYRKGLSLMHSSWSILDPDTEEERPLTPSNSVGSFTSFRSSPDGNRIAVSSESGLWVISLKDNSESLLTKEQLIPCGWSPDGGLVYAWKAGAANDERALLAVPAAGGNPRPIVTLPKGIHPEGMSPDGRKFVCTVRETKSDVWLMENFDPARQK